MDWLIAVSVVSVICLLVALLPWLISSARERAKDSRRFPVVRNYR
jgi:hypothetical protein